MLKEFAVDPAVITSSFETCRYLIDQFGVDKGRLIAKFPSRWKRMAYEAADSLPDGLNKERVVEYINGLGSEWLTLTSSNRAYASPEGPWLDNALTAHAGNPFSAILCDQDDLSRQLVDGRACDEKHPLFQASHSAIVNRNAVELAAVGRLVLENCRVLRLIDPHFKPARPKWRSSLREMLCLIPNITNVSCEYHVHDKPDSPDTDELKRQLAQLRGSIPAGGQLRIIRWQEQDDGERQHRRYLLTENAGLYFEGGLDEEVGAKQTTDVGALGRDVHRQRWSEYNLDAHIYDLVHPILVVDSQGTVTEE